MEYQFSKGLINLIFNDEKIAKKQFEKLNNFNEDGNTKRIEGIYISCDNRLITINPYNASQNWREIVNQIIEILIGLEEVVVSYQNENGNNVSSYFEKGIDSNEIDTNIRIKQTNPFLETERKI